MGAIVRLSLFFIGFLFIGFICLIGLIGLIIWLLIPGLSLPWYKKLNSKPNFDEFLHLHTHPDTNEPDKSTDLDLAKKMYDLRVTQLTSIQPKPFAGSNLAMNLSLGYTPNLDKYSIAIQPNPSTPLFREPLLSRLTKTIEANKNIILVGQPGVGKSTAIANIARQLIATKRLREVNFNDLLSQVMLDLNQKKHTLTTALFEAASSGNIVIVIRDIHRFTNSSVEGYDFTDSIEQVLDRSESLQLIAVVTPTEYERYISGNMRLRKLFDTIDIAPPSKQDMPDILMTYANSQELTKNIIIPTSLIRLTVDFADRYISDVPFPRKAIELLDSAISHRQIAGGHTLAKEDLLAVVTEKTGIPLGNLTSADKAKLSNLEARIHERLIGQELAVSLIARSLRARATGLGGETKPVGSFLFLGPTGVGKTETAKVLAEVYYGSETQIIRFDMAEYAHRDGLVRLMGSPENNQPGTLTTAIKNHSAGLLLLDEIEKAPPEIFNLFLTMLDEGYLVDAFGRKINCQHLFIIATSNAGAEYIREQVSSGVSGDILQRQVVEYLLSRGHFSPEFINRFDAVVVYQPLTTKQLESIASLQLARLKKRLLQQNIEITIDPLVVTELCSSGYDPSYGARPMRRIVDLVIGDLLSRAMLADEIKPGSKINLSVHNHTFTWSNSQPHSQQVFSSK